MTKTTDTTMDFSQSETDALADEMGTDAEYYEQGGQTFAVSFEGGMAEWYAIDRAKDGTLINVDGATAEFDWDSAEKFRGSPFPDTDFGDES